MRSLIVDDELVSREKLLNIMDSFGQCAAVENGEDALRVAASQDPPDLILLDVSMPGMGGYEVCKRLKANRRTSNIPVIFVSVRSGEDDEAEGLGLGAVDYITKPFSPSIVKARVRTHLELKKHRNRLEELVNERTVELEKATKEMQVEIAERKRAEESLRESEEKYRLLIENATDAIFIAQDEILKFTNPEAEKMTGYSAEELAQISFVNIIHPEDRAMVLERHLKRLKGEQLPSIYSFRILNKSGEELSVNLNTVLINWKKRPATLNFLRDITRQKRLEAQLQQAQKMEAIGTLAGGIAHDFNNLLMGIQGRTSIMLMDKDSSHPDFRHLKGIEVYLGSAADLTKQLLGFARGGKFDVKPTDLNELIKKENRMFGRTKKEIIISGKYEENLWSVEVDRGQIQQVLLNLYVNAWQAMPGGGDLYVRTENVTLDKGYVKPFSIEYGRYVKISVTDTGIGMDKATQEKIFDPFFTTKGMGRGTGLGLASSYGIIKNHGGFINVYSEKGHGSTFNIYLPASEKEVIEEKKSSGDIVKGSETVLFVDDEDMIIEVAEEMFKDMGYKILVAGGGKEAVKIYEKNKDRIDIVILDMIMPDMSGSMTYDRMKEIDPDIKVLLSSGYSINGQATEILGRGCNGFIQKPFNMKELSEKLREILDEE